MDETDFKFMYVMKKYKASKTDDGWREVYFNEKTNEYKFKHCVGYFQRDPLYNSAKIQIWEWDD